MKKLIEAFIQRLLSKCRKNDKRYYFARFLAALVKNEKKTNDVTYTIANYFMIYNKGVKFEFDDIFVVGDVVYVQTIRPGYWIGKGGSVVDQIISMLNYDKFGKKIANYEVRFIEQLTGAKSMITSYMVTVYSNDEQEIFVD